MKSITHASSVTLTERILDIESRMKELPLTPSDLAVAAGLLKEMQESPLGQHLILHGSLDGFWTKYCVADQVLKRKTKLSRDLGPVESFLLNEAPAFIATQERFEIFRQITQSHIVNSATLASVPCGFMDDLLSLDYSQATGVRLVGLDVDPKSVEGALANARSYGLNVEAYLADAWDLSCYRKQFSLVTSNGLNIYVPDIESEIELYRSIASTLVPGGYVVTSFLTPPPSIDRNSPWQISDQAAALKQKMIFSDVLNVKWQVFRTEFQITQMLASVGLTVLKIVYDHQRIFPTVLARYD